MKELTIATNELVYTVTTADIDRELLERAEKFTLWSWYDIMTAFREIGYQPTEAEELRIKRALFTKKLKHIIKDI